MTGYVFAMGGCICCGRLFSFNPNSVPSTSAITGSREPVCQSCMAVINERRAAAGLEPFPILPDAYEPLPESELC
jgi:hypothetical protein